MKDDLSSYFDSQEFQEILAQFEQMLETHSVQYFDSVDLANVSEYYRAVGDKQKSDMALKFGLDMHPGNPDILIAKAASILGEGKIKEARVITESLADTYDRELFFLKGNIELADHNPELADTYYDMAVRAGEPDNGLMSDIIVQFMDSKHLDYAQKWCSKAIVSDPDSRNLQELQADLYTETQEYDLAIELYNRLHDDFAFDTYYWEQLLNIHYKRGEKDKVAECCEFIEAIDPGHTTARIMKVNLLVEDGQYEQALILLKPFIDENQTSGELLYFYGLCLSLLDKMQEAENYLLKACRTLFFNDSMHLLTAATLRYAQVTGSLGHNEAAVRLLNRALYLYPNDAILHIQKARNCFAMDKDSTAFSEYKKACNLIVGDKNQEQSAMMIQFIEEIVLEMLEAKNKLEPYLLLRAFFMAMPLKAARNHPTLLTTFVLCCITNKDRRKYRKYLPLAWKDSRDYFLKMMGVKRASLKTAMDRLWLVCENVNIVKP